MKRFIFWQQWLFVSGFAISFFGLYMSFFSGTPLFYLFDSSINPVFWGAADIASKVKEFQKWVYGAWGATVTGWGIFVIFIAQYPFQKREKWSWNCLFTGLLLWYGIDTGFSAYSGVYANVVFNTLVFIAGMAPLVFTKKYFAG